VNGLIGTSALVRFVLRRDRIRLPVWIGSILAITYASAEAVANTYDTPAEIASYAENLGNSPATIAMAGPPVALEQIGGILVYETSLTALLGVALMAAFTVVRHTRGEEEEGRTELLVSTVVGRHAGAAAAVLVASAASVLVGLGVSGSMLAVDMPARGAWLYGASVTALGLVFAAVAGVCAQLMSHGRSATGLVLAVLAVSFLLRAVGDVQESSLSWLSPIGWSQQVRVLDENRWWPLLFSAVMTLGLLAATVLLATRRDVGSGIVPARPGPADAAAALRSPLALAWRLQRGSLLAWSVGVFALGAMFGSLSEEMQNMVRDNPTLAQYFEITGGSITDALFASALMFNALGAAAFAVASALRIRHSETVGTLEPVLATGISRTRALLEPLVVTVVGAALMLVVGAVGAALAWIVQSGEVGPAVRLVGLSLVYGPGVLVLVGLAVALIGLVPRLTLVAWVGVAIAFVVGWLGGLLDLPAWISGLSPFEHLPLVPVDDVTAAPLVGLSLVALALAAGGLWGFRRRDVT
jgi:ABC-2 type transport system permease protein